MGGESEPDRPSGTASGEELVGAACNETEGREGGCGETGKDAAFADEEKFRRRALHSIGQQRSEISHRVGKAEIKAAFKPIRCAVESCVFSKGVHRCI